MVAQPITSLSSSYGASGSCGIQSVWASFRTILDWCLLLWPCFTTDCTIRLGTLTHRFLNRTSTCTELSRREYLSFSLPHLNPRFPLEYMEHTLVRLEVGLGCLSRQASRSLSNTDSLQTCHRNYPAVAHHRVDEWGWRSPSWETGPDQWARRTSRCASYHPPPSMFAMFLPTPRANDSALWKLIMSTLSSTVVQTREYYIPNERWAL
jgi:hypothetical protein